MSKVLSLWRNELARIIRRPFLFVVTIIMTALCLGFTGLFKFVNTLDQMDYNNWYNDESIIDDEINHYQNEITALEQALTQSTSGTVEYENIMSDLVSAYNEQVYYQTLKEYELPYYTIEKSFLDETAYSLASAQTNLKYSDYYQLNEQEISRFENQISRYQSILKKQSYKEYIDLQKDLLKEQNYSEEEKAIYEQALDYQYTCNPEGILSIVGEAEQWKNDKLSLLHKQYYSDGVYVPLTESLTKELENNIAVYEYKMGKGLLQNTSNENFPVELALSATSGLCRSFLLFVLIILAGGCISSDIQSGAVKGLIIAPVKRSKIFFAKILSLLTVGVIGTLVCALISLASQCLFFGYSSIPPYIFASGGTAHKLSPVLYLIAQMFVWLLPVLLVMTFAVMLSAVTRSTAISIGVSIAVYFVCSSALSFINLGIVKGEWVKFLPFQHMDLTTAFFPYSTVSSLLDAVGFTTAPSLGFSLIYLFVLTLCLGYIAFDSFTRRDI
ncbi:MAG: ABC transporter permease subunit [Clostridiales bacterium]|nr:ABC transporter permease subunit [Clostridiales bacterium]